jgi:hypothetical protein
MRRAGPAQQAIARVGGRVALASTLVGGGSSAACAVSESPSSIAAGDQGVDDVVPTRVLLLEAADYRTWPRFVPHRGGAVRSAGHRDLWFVAHYNHVAAEIVEAGGLGEFPVGSIIVGENRVEPTGVPIALTTMVKGSQSWRWIEHDPDGRVLRTGELDTCRDCHSHAAHDMVFGVKGAR